MLVNRKVVQVKIESSYGVDAVPVAGTDDVLVEQPAWATEGLRMTDRPSVRASIGKLQQIYGGSLRAVTFDVEMKGSGGAADAPPEFGPLLRACGWGETINAAVDVTYDPVSTGHESVTIYFFEDGIRHNLLGCVGNFSFSGETGGYGRLSFRMVGHLVGPTDVAMVTPTYQSNVPPPLLSVPFTIGGYSAKINSLNFDMGNTIATPPDMGASDGYSQIRITQRDINGSYDPESVIVATDDPHGDLKAGNTLALTTGVVGSGTGGKYQLNMDQVYYRDISPGDRDGVSTLEIPFGASEGTGDDDAQLIFS